MFDQVFDSMRKAADSTIAMQQDLFNRWVGLWSGIPGVPSAGEPQKLQKKWLEAVSEVVKTRRETMEAQFSAGMQNIEEAFRLAEAKDPEELRTKTVALWQKMFDCLRQTSEVQIRDFQTAVAKWTELMSKGTAT